MSEKAKKDRLPVSQSYSNLPPERDAEEGEEKSLHHGVIPDWLDCKGMAACIEILPFATTSLVKTFRRLPETGTLSLSHAVPAVCFSHLG